MNLRDMALSLAPEAREQYLRTACSDSPQLFDEVWRHVQAEVRMQGFLLEPFRPPPQEEHPLEPGTILENRFRILREVGRGGMAVVYEAQDEKLNLRIAIKWPKAGHHARMPPEVQHARKIAHPNVCKVFEIHPTSREDERIDFLVMEFLEGETLAERINRGLVEKKEALRIALQIC